MTQEIGFLDGNNGYTNKIKQAMYSTSWSGEFGQQRYGMFAAVHRLYDIKE